MTPDEKPVTEHEMHAFAESRDALYDVAHRAETEAWNERRARNISRVNRRFMVLYMALALGVGYLAYRGQVADDRLREAIYQACEDRTVTVAAYNASVAAPLRLTIPTCVRT